MDQLEGAWLDSLHVDRLYVKFFDLDWDPASGEVVPLAPVVLDTQGLAGRRIIPVIFITNRSMLQIAPADIPTLARHIAEKIDRQFAPLGQVLTELQLDCDWTDTSRDNFFSLLEQLRQVYAHRLVQLSVTIRLHQLRFPERTGIPPADRGVLMFYNMGDLQDWAEPNSILNPDKASAYLPQGLTYALPLDLALPLFRWAVLFRDGRMIRLINEPDERLLADRGKYFPIGPQRYQVIQSTYLHGHYLYRGDRLRLESVSVPQLAAALQLVRDRYAPATGGLILYHLDGAVLGRYDVGEVRTLIGR